MNTFLRAATHASAFICLTSAFILTAACSQDSEMPVLVTEKPAHLGPLRLESPMTLETVSNLFPAFQVTSGQAMSEGMAYPVLRVWTSDHEPLFVIAINPDRPVEGQVKIESAAIRLDNGATVGQSFSALHATFTYEECLPGMEEQSGKVYCPLKDSPTISYVFNGSYNGPDGEVPPKEALHNFTVRSIVWDRR